DLLSDELICRVAAVGEHFRRRLREALGGLPLFAEVRGVGLIVGIAVRPAGHPWLSFEHFGLGELGGRPTTGLLLCHRLYRRGYFGFVCGHDWAVLRLQPRFFIETQRLDAFADACREELAYLGELAS